MIDLTEPVLDFRCADGVPNLVGIGGTVIAASRAMHIKDVDERISVENVAVLAIAKKRELIKA